MEGVSKENASSKDDSAAAAPGSVSAAAAPKGVSNEAALKMISRKCSDSRSLRWRSAESPDWFTSWSRPKYESKAPVPVPVSDPSSRKEKKNHEGSDSSDKRNNCHFQKKVQL